MKTIVDNGGKVYRKAGHTWAKLEIHYLEEISVNIMCENLRSCSIVGSSKSKPMAKFSLSLSGGFTPSRHLKPSSERKHTVT